MPWRWDAAIGLLGLARTLPSPPVERFIRSYYRHHDGGARIVMPDHCAPVLAALEARSVLGEDATRRAIDRTADFLRKQPRNALGALNHLGVVTSLSRAYPDSIWIDSLMMYALPAVAIGRALGDSDLEAFGLAQPRIFAELLQDRRTGLFRHAYLVERAATRPRAPVFWLRGNGWVVAALVEMLEHDRCAANLRILRALATGLLRHQGDDGMWPTVVDDARTYAESSGTALVAYALAKAARLRLLPVESRDAAQRAFAALRARMVRRVDGLSLRGISGPTIPSRRSGYALVPRRADISYGVGAMLLLADELQRPPP